MPPYTEARVDSADFTEPKPAEYRADLVVLLLESRAAQIAHAAHLATLDLDPERGRMYFDLVMNALSEAARKELRAMDPAKYVPQSDYAKQWIGVGRIELLERLLTRRFGPLPPAATERLSTATIDELDAIGERLLTAPSLDEALGPPPSRP